MKAALAVASRQQWLDWEDMVLTREDLELLKRLQAAGERGRTIPEFNTRIALQRLARAATCPSCGPRVGQLSDHAARQRRDNRT